jgi:Raf kinase inhibitor-like YbhB/YbcL family protein
MNTQSTARTPFLLLTLIFIGGVAKSQTDNNFTLISSAFEEGKPIPAKYTCDGTNVPPPLSWSGVPQKTKSFAIIMDDPDAPMGTWVHWVMYNIPDSVRGLKEEVSVLQISAVDGVNSSNEMGYYGPCPPGGTHRYVFKLYALDKMLPQKERMGKEELLEAMKGHILRETTLTGLFRNG